MKAPILVTAALSSALVLGACSDADLETSPLAPEVAMDRQNPNSSRAPAKGSMSIAEIVTASAENEVLEEREFTLLLAAIEYIAATNPSSELLEGLFNKDQYTVFAPKDQAFLDLVDAVAGELDPAVLENEGPFAAIDDFLGFGTIEAVVSYHVTEGRRAANSVIPPNRDRTIETLLTGATFSVDSDGMITAVGNTASIDLDMANISASNGIIHAIDAVILPIVLDL